MMPIPSGLRATTPGGACSHGYAGVRSVTSGRACYAYSAHGGRHAHDASVRCSRCDERGPTDERDDRCGARRTRTSLNAPATRLRAAIQRPKYNHVTDSGVGRCIRTVAFTVVVRFIAAFLTSKSAICIALFACADLRARHAIRCSASI